MEEIVEYSPELRIPFYEDLASSGILNRTRNTEEGNGKTTTHSAVNVQKLMQQEDSFELKINSSLMTIHDYYDYIKFKKDLFAKVGVRGKGNPKAQHFQQIIKAHIKKLYVECLSHFPRDLALWSAYIRFCKIARFISEGTAAYKEILSFHESDPDYWLAAAEWEYDLTRNIKAAQKLLLTGIRKHPTQSHLYIKLFKVLLAGSQSEESPDYKLALALYETSTKRDFGVDFWAKALEAAEEYPFTTKLQALLLGDIVEKFVHTELAWHILAQRELKGLPNGEIIKERLDPEGLEVPDATPPTPLECITPRRKYRFELCAEIYQAGCSVVNTEQMWTYYIDAMVKLNKDIKSGIVFKRGHLVAAFSGALEAKRLSESLFRDYVNLMREAGANDECLMAVVKQGPALYPESAVPWELLMHHHIIRNDDTEINKTFERACRELKDSECTFPLWQMLIRYYELKMDKDDYVCELYAKACREPSPKFLPLRVLYLEFCITKKPIEDVRKVYEELMELPPPYLPLHKRMALLESGQINPDIISWRRCHRNTVDLFGKEQAGLWVDFMDFEKNYGDCTRISQICEEATIALEVEAETDTEAPTGDT